MVQSNRSKLTTHILELIISFYIWASRHLQTRNVFVCFHYICHLICVEKKKKITHLIVPLRVSSFISSCCCFVCEVIPEKVCNVVRSGNWYIPFPLKKEKQEFFLCFYLLLFFFSFLLLCLINHFFLYTELDRQLSLHYPIVSRRRYLCVFCLFSSMNLFSFLVT